MYGAVVELVYVCVCEKFLADNLAKLKAGGLKRQRPERSEEAKPLYVPNVS